MAATASAIATLAIGGLKEILPMLRSGDRKKLAGAAVRVAEKQLRDNAERLRTQDSAVASFIDEFQALAESGEPLTPTTLRFFMMSLKFAVEADRKDIQGRIDTQLVIADNLDAAVDHLLKQDDEAQ